MDAELKDSGKREEFSTGSQRDSREGKGRFDLLLMGMPEALRRLAVLLERGARKYGERNWEKGQPISRYLDSAVRHLSRAADGQLDEDHWIQAAWNCLAAVETAHRAHAGDLPGELIDLSMFGAPQETEQEPNQGKPDWLLAFEDECAKLGLTSPRYEADWLYADGGRALRAPISQPAAGETNRGRNRAHWILHGNTVDIYPSIG